MAVLYKIEIDFDGPPPSKAWYDPDMHLYTRAQAEAKIDILKKSPVFPEHKSRYHLVPAGALPQKMLGAFPHTKAAWEPKDLKGGWRAYDNLGKSNELHIDSGHNRGFAMQLSNGKTIWRVTCPDKGGRDYETGPFYGSEAVSGNAKTLTEAKAQVKKLLKTCSRSRR